MAVHDAKTTYGHCKNLIKLFETLIDPIFPIVGSVVLEEPRGTYASRKQMIPASHLRIHKPKSSGSHRFIPRTAEASIVPTTQILPQKQTLVNKKMPVLYLSFGKQMIPASHLRIHKPKSSGSHRFISRTAEASIVSTSQIIPQKQTLVNKKCLSFIRALDLLDEWESVLIGVPICGVIAQSTFL
jgi:hypothetical protein